MTAVLSPDARAYVDLTLFDRDPQAIFDLALQLASSQMPDWIPRAADPGVVILESGALEVAEAVYAINRLPGATVETVLRMFDVAFDPGAAPVATVTFSLIDSAGHTIPAGTRLRLDVNDTPIVFTTDADGVAAASEDEVTVAVTGTQLTAAANGTTSGTELSVLDSSYFVEQVVLATDVISGRDPEDSQAWFNRAIQRFRRLTEALNMAPQFEAMALEDPAIFRVHAVDLYDGDGGPPYNDTGHISIYVYGPTGPVSAGDKTDLDAALQEAAQVNLAVHVLDATVNTVDIDAEINVVAGAVEATVIAAVEDALAAYLSPFTWDWDATVRLNDIIQVIENVPGVDFTTAGSVKIEDSAADFSLSGDGPLVTAGDLTITVPE